jgi:hypothetical protein
VGERPRRSLGSEREGKVKKVFRPFQFSFDKIVVSNKWNPYRIVNE